MMGTKMTQTSEKENYNPNAIDEYCVDCSTEYEDLLGGLDKELIKLGFIKGEGVNETLTKPFPFTYNDWWEGYMKR